MSEEDDDGRMIEEELCDEMEVGEARGGGKYFRHCGTNVTASDVIELLLHPPEYTTTSVPLFPPLTREACAVTFVCDISETEYADIFKDALSPWSPKGSGSRPKTQDYEVFEDESVSKYRRNELAKRGELYLHQYYCRHGTLNHLIKQVHLLMIDGRPSSSYAAVSYSFESATEEVFDIRQFEKRTTVSERERAKAIIRKGGGARAVLARIPSIKQNSVRNILQSVERRKSLSGRKAATNYGELQHLIDSGYYVVGDWQSNGDHHLLLAHEWQIELFARALPTEDQLKTHLERTRKRLEVTTTVDTGMLRRVLSAVMADGTFNLVDNFVVTAIGFYDNRFKSRDSSKDAFLTACLMLSRRRTGADYRKMGLMLYDEFEKKGYRSPEVDEDAVSLVDISEDSADADAEPSAAVLEVVNEEEVDENADIVDVSDEHSYASLESLGVIKRRRGIQAATTSRRPLAGIQNARGTGNEETQLRASHAAVLPTASQLAQFHASPHSLPFTEPHHNNNRFVIALRSERWPLTVVRKDTCVGCGIALPSTACDGSAEDLVLVHKERYSYYNKKDGQKEVSHKDQRLAVLHCRLNCLMSRYSYATPARIALSPSLALSMKSIYSTWIKMTFNIHSSQIALANNFE